MAPAEYFGVSLESIRIAGRVAGELASCCGVNLAFAGFGGVGFSGERDFRVAVTRPEGHRDRFRVREADLRSAYAPFRTSGPLLNGAPFLKACQSIDSRP